MRTYLIVPAVTDIAGQCRIVLREGRYGEVPPITRRQLAMLVPDAT